MKGDALQAFIVGYNNKYLISNRGEIHSYKGGTWKRLKSQKNKNGYYYINLYFKGKRKVHYIHRLVATYFVEGDVRDMTVNHIDGDKSNNFSSNLEIISQKENNKHAHKNNLINKKGENCNFSKLNDLTVLEIRRLFNVGMKQNKIAELFDISRATISLIVNRKIWRHL